MGDFNKVEKICGFYVSNIHLVTMILPYIKKEINKNTKIEVITEYDLNNNINNILSNLIINDEEKEKILNINWSSNKIQKYSNIETKIKNNLIGNNEIIILINGSRKYIENANIIIEKILNKNINKINNNKIKIIDCYEVTEFDDNIREMLDIHQFIINTSGVHKIEDIFENYKKKLRKNG